MTAYSWLWISSSRVKNKKGKEKKNIQNGRTRSMQQDSKVGESQREKEKEGEKERERGGDKMRVRVFGMCLRESERNRVAKVVVVVVVRGGGDLRNQWIIVVWFHQSHFNIQEEPPCHIVVFFFLRRIRIDTYFLVDVDFYIFPICFFVFFFALWCCKMVSFVFWIISKLIVYRGPNFKN